MPGTQACNAAHRHWVLAHTAPAVAAVASQACPSCHEKRLWSFCLPGSSCFCVPSSPSWFQFIAMRVVTVHAVTDKPFAPATAAAAPRYSILLAQWVRRSLGNPVLDAPFRPRVLIGTFTAIISSGGCSTHALCKHAIQGAWAQQSPESCWRRHAAYGGTHALFPETSDPLLYTIYPCVVA